MHRPRAPSPCTVIALCPGSLPAPSPAPRHRPRAPTVPVHRYRALPPVPFLHLPVHRDTVPVHRYRALPRSPSCTFPCTRAPSPCTLIARCPAPLHRSRARPCRYRALPRSPLHPYTCTVIALCLGPLHPHTVPVHPVTGPNPAPNYHNLTGWTLHLPVHPRTVPVHRYRAPVHPCHLPRAPLSRAPVTLSPCTVIALCPGPLSAPSRAPVHRPRARPCTVIALCPGPLHPYTVPVHRYRALPRSPSPAHHPRAPSRSQPCRIT